MRIQFSRDWIYEFLYEVTSMFVLRIRMNRSLAGNQSLVKF